MVGSVGMVPGALLSRYPNVEVQTVLGQLGVGVPHLLALETGKVLVSFLVARARQRGGVEHAGPRVHGYRAPEPERAHGWLGERYARVHVHLAVRNDFRVSGHQARGSGHHRRLLGIFGRRSTGTGARTAARASAAAARGATAAATARGAGAAARGTVRGRAFRAAVGRRPAQHRGTAQQQRHRAGINAIDAHVRRDLRKRPVREIARNGTCNEIENQIVSIAVWL